MYQNYWLRSLPSGFPPLPVSLASLTAAAAAAAARESKDGKDPAAAEAVAASPEKPMFPSGEAPEEDGGGIAENDEEINVQDLEEESRKNQFKKHKILET